MSRTSGGVVLQVIQEQLQPQNGTASQAGAALEGVFFVDNPCQPGPIEWSLLDA